MSRQSLFEGLLSFLREGNRFCKICSPSRALLSLKLHYLYFCISAFSCSLNRVSYMDIFIHINRLYASIDLNKRVKQSNKKQRFSGKGSPRGTTDFLQKRFPPRITKSPKNLRFSGRGSSRGTTDFFQKPPSDNKKQQTVDYIKGRDI